MRLRLPLAFALLFGCFAAVADDGVIDLASAPPSAWLADDLGFTSIIHHPWGAFPDGNLSVRGDGRGRGRIAASAFQDDSTLVFVPHDLRPSRPIRLLVHLHGWRGNLTGERPVSEAQHLRESVLCSGTNTVLVVPQGPSGVKSSRFGNLESVTGFTSFLVNLPQALPSGTLPDGWLDRVDDIAISGHSGGGSPISRLLWDGASRLDDGDGTPRERWAWDRLQTVILFDATYSGGGALQRWWAARPGRKLKSYYLERSPTAPVSASLAALATQWPERAAELRVEGISVGELPPMLRSDAHYSIPWYRLWDGLDAAPGKCPWSDAIAEGRGGVDVGER
jgi:hypothetical protein